jgi:hypothetical protein
LLCLLHEKEGYQDLFEQNPYFSSFDQTIPTISVLLQVTFSTPIKGIIEGKLG